MKQILRKADETIDSALSAEENASLREILRNNFINLLRKASKIVASNVIPAIHIVYSLNATCTYYSVLAGKNMHAFNEEVTTALMNASVINTIGHTKGLLIESYVKIIAESKLSSYIKIAIIFLESNSEDCNGKFISDVRNIFETDNIDEVYNRIKNVIEQMTAIGSDIRHDSYTNSVIQ